MYMLTIQHIFDAAWRHFIVNKQPYSLDSTDGCAYRGANGTKCIVGLVIPDGKWDDDMWDNHATAIFERLGITPVEEKRQFFITLDQMRQELHDTPAADNASHNELRQLYLKFADLYSLTVPLDPKIAHTAISHADSPNENKEVYDFCVRFGEQIARAVDVQYPHLQARRLKKPVPRYICHTDETRYFEDENYVDFMAEQTGTDRCMPFAFIRDSSEKAVTIRRAYYNYLRTQPM